MKHRVIWTCDFGRSGESPGFDEYFITVPLDLYITKEIAECLNRRYADKESGDYYRVVPENYVLQKFEV